MRGVSLGRVGDLPLEAHWSWPLALALGVGSLGAGRFPELYPWMTPGPRWAAAVVATGLCSCSIVLHELAHAAVATRCGVGVKRVTLFVFGGVAQAGAEPARPGDELRIALAGPAASATIAAMCAGGSWIAANVTASPSSELVAAVLWQVALVNAVLAAFNLLPAFPLDGGRVLRALLWRRAGSRQGATETAALAGRCVAAGFLLYGVTQLASGRLVLGAWVAFLGVFLDRAGAMAPDRDRAIVVAPAGGSRE